MGKQLHNMRFTELQNYVISQDIRNIENPGDPTLNKSLWSTQWTLGMLFKPVPCDSVHSRGALVIHDGSLG